MLKTTAWSVLHKRLVFQPYCIQLVQQFAVHHRHWLDFCLHLQDLMSTDDHFLEREQFIDEATFLVSGTVNRGNVRIRGLELILIFLYVP
jgi:hypothetical protein